MPNPLSDPFWQAENKALRAAIAEIAVDIMLAAAENAIAMLPAGAQILVDWTLINQDVMAYLNGRYLTDVLPVINGTTRRVLRPIIEDWIRSGEPLAALEKRLVPLFGDVRAARIAATEVTHLYSAGNMIAWGATGMVSGKKWFSVRDDRVCSLCGPLHGQIVELSSQFVQTAEQIAASPQLRRIVGSDPTKLLLRAQNLLKWNGAAVIGPPRHVNCVLPGNIIVPPGRIVAAAKSFYSGLAVEITISDGRRITVTAHHPILSREGFVPAYQVHQGMYLMASVDRYGRSLSAPQYDYVPTAIEEIYSTLKMSAFMTADSVPASPVDFNGDGKSIEGDVEIVYPNGLLGSNGQARINEQASQDSFLLGDMELLPFGSVCPHNHFFNSRLSAPDSLVGSGNLGRFLFNRHLRPFQGFGLGLTPGFNPAFSETATNDKAANTVLFRQGINRHAGMIIGDDSWNIQPPNATADLLIDPDVMHVPDNGLLTDAPFPGEFCNRFPGQISPFEVISVRKFDFSDHVYDLQIEPYEIYITNGIITHNCRCYLLPVLSEELIRQQIAGALASGFFAKAGRPELLNSLIREGRR